VGVAAAGVGGLSSALNRPLKLAGLSGIGLSSATSMAGGIANAATRSLANGTSFGDNMLAALPDIIGGTIGSLIAGRIGRRSINSDSIHQKAAADPGTGSGGAGDDWKAGLSPEAVRLAEMGVIRFADGGPPVGGDGPSTVIRRNTTTGRDEVTSAGTATCVSPTGPFTVWNDDNRTSFRNGQEWERAQYLCVTPRSLEETNSEGFFSRAWTQVSSLFNGFEWPSVTLNQQAAGLPSYDAGLQVRMQGGDSISQAMAQRQGMNNFYTQMFGNMTYGVFETGVASTTTSVFPPMIFATERSSSPYIVSGGRLGLTSSPWLNMPLEAAFARLGARLATPASPRAYSTLFEMELRPVDLGRSRSVHFNRANGALDNALRSDREMLTMFESEVPGIGASVSRTGGRQTPQDWTWEHASTSTANGRSGVMRLVPTEQHTPGSQWWRILHPDTGARGGYSEWAIPAGAPRNR
jgi:hypothetical protein